MGVGMVVEGVVSVSFRRPPFLVKGEALCAYITHLAVDRTIQFMWMRHNWADSRLPARTVGSFKQSRTERANKDSACKLPTFNGEIWAGQRGHPLALWAYQNVLWRKGTNNDGLGYLSAGFNK